MGAVLVGEHRDERRHGQPHEERRGGHQPDLGCAEAAKIQPHRQIGQVDAVNQEQRGIEQPDAQRERLRRAVRCVSNLCLHCCIHCCILATAVLRHAVPRPSVSRSRLPKHANRVLLIDTCG